MSSHATDLVQAHILLIFTDLLFSDVRRERHYKMAASVRLSLCLSVCRVPRANSRTERPWKPKIGKMEAHHTDNP